MVLQVGVYHPALVVQAPLLLEFSEEALLLPGRLPFSYGCRSSWVVRAYKRGIRDTSVLIGTKDKPKVAVFLSSKVSLGQRCVFHH